MSGKGVMTMQEEPQVPKATDAVLGGGIALERESAVLGGLEGLRQGLLQGSVEQRVAGIQEAMKYGQAGVEVVVSALENVEMENEVRWAAYQLLKDSPKFAVMEVLQRTLPFVAFDVATIRVDQRINRRLPFSFFEFEQSRRGFQRRKGYAQYFTEDLGNGVELEMMLVPGGTFWMGSPVNEPDRNNSESPQHSVTVPSFFMGRYPVTQAQWRTIADLSKVRQQLNPDPSYFKGSEGVASRNENRPVERVSWGEAVEFCDRLSFKTGREYRLPSEAEWEYACRAGTRTPFHFGEVMTTEVANYGRRETTPAGDFEVANAFGLCDMHGNVWEWCLDHWHDNYNDAPTDGRAWLIEDENARRVLRGGSWLSPPRHCRSASRDSYFPDLALIKFGLRVVCVVPRILQ